jgi:hypothetical protein
MTFLLVDILFMLTFTFPLPPCLNEQIDLARTHWSKSASIKKLWTNKIAQLCKSNGKIQGKFYIVFYWQVKFSRDSDNVNAAAKFIFDGLVKAGIIESDSLMYVQSPVLHFYEKAGKEQVIIKISETPIFIFEEVNNKRSAIAV